MSLFFFPHQMVPIYNIMFGNMVEFKQVGELHDLEVLIFRNEFLILSTT